MITLNDFTTSADTHHLTADQEQALLEIARFFQDDLNKKAPTPVSGNGRLQNAIKLSGQLAAEDRSSIIVPITAPSSVQ